MAKQQLFWWHLRIQMLNHQINKPNRNNKSQLNKT